jgi:hypothetical protein
MNFRTLLLVCLLCTAAVPVMYADSNYMGGNIVLGGSGPNTIKITEVPTAVVQATVTVPAQVQPGTGSVSVATSPKGASIVIDGVQRGISPATIPGLSPGSHTLLVKLDGYADLSVPVSVTGGQTKDYALVLTPLAGAAAATPAPPGKKTPGFEALTGIAALGAVLLILKTTR